MESMDMLNTSKTSKCAANDPDSYCMSCIRDESECYSAVRMISNSHLAEDLAKQVTDYQSLSSWSLCPSHCLFVLMFHEKSKKSQGPYTSHQIYSISTHSIVHTLQAV